MKAYIQPLIAMVEDLIGKEPYETNGFKWAARPQPFYCEALGISPKTLRNWIAKPPFCREIKKIGGVKLCLLRIGEPAPKTPHDYAKVLRGVWRNKTGRVPSQHEKQCLWGYCKDVMALPEVQAFTDNPGEFAVAALKHALNHWQFTAGCIKLAAEAIPGYKPRFWEFPNLPTMRRFYKSVVYVYAMALQAQAKIPNANDLPALLLATAKQNQLAAILEATDEAADHPGVDDPQAPVKEWPLKEPWKPLPFKSAAE